MDKKRWTREECPYPISLSRRRRPYEKTQNEIKKWEDFKDEDKKILIEIKKVISLFLDNPIIKVFGSRVNGTWIESSDWDIAIIGLIPDLETRNKIINYNYGCLVDIQFHSKIKKDDILIP